MTNEIEKVKAAANYYGISKIGIEDGLLITRTLCENREDVIGGFTAGVAWRDQNPSREMVSRIMNWARTRYHDDYGVHEFSLDEIMAELEKEK